MKTFVEGHLRFEFGPSWQVEKYDEHPIYREGIERLKEQIPCTHCLHPQDVGSKAVDFVGIYKGQPYFIEVKDFRGHAIENSRRTQGALAIEVALKVRDTVAGLLGVCRADIGRPLIEPIFKQAPAVLLWLEEDPPRSKPEQQSHMMGNLKTMLCRGLSWLNPGRVMVMKRAQLWPALELRVRSIPDRVYELQMLMKKPTPISLKEPRSISREEFCRAWSTPPLTAGEELKRLCHEGILAPAPGGGDRFTAGPQWDKLLDE